MEEALFALLSGAAPVAAIAGPRIFWGIAPQSTAYPRISLFIISGADAPHLQGTDGLWTYRVQVDCYAADRPTSRRLSRAIITLLNGHRAGGFRGIFIDGVSREGREETANDKPYRFTHDFFIHWRDI
ncbi:DUF3168 domain-containing protein [Paracoccus nototheniae]|uniref:DUF3168 domain-containing protein n=1 Tax=Paracoccus nototheniae TaxID=2489002 RepID=A0ABW4DWV1_9RHOB|nr:DUF3168 domain-containing protein [Paracoccus nototheniae]